MIPREAYPYDTPAGAAKGFPSLARVEPEQGPFPAAQGGDLLVCFPLPVIAPGGWQPLGECAAWKLAAPHWPNNDHEQDGA